MKENLRFSTNYSNFKKTTDNRIVDVNSPHFKKVLSSIEKHGYIPAYPIHVRTFGSGYEIIDGQHRFEAAKTLGVQFSYVVYDNGEIDIPTLNNTQGKWKATDYLESYAAQGIREYVKLKEIYDITKLPISVLVGIFAANDSYVIQFCKGELKITNESNGLAIVDFIENIKQIYPQAKNTRFVRAIRICFRNPLFSLKKLQQKMHTNPALLYNCPETVAFIEMIEKVYNYRSPHKDKISLKFEATK